MKERDAGRRMQMARGELPCDWKPRTRAEIIASFTSMLDLALASADPADLWWAEALHPVPIKSYGGSHGFSAQTFGTMMVALLEVKMRQGIYTEEHVRSICEHAIKAARS